MMPGRRPATTVTAWPRKDRHVFDNTKPKDAQAKPGADQLHTLARLRFYGDEFTLTQKEKILCALENFSIDNP